MVKKECLITKSRKKGKRIFCFRRNYLLYAVILFILEVFIALYVRDRFIRPYGGDILVIIFLYCLYRGFLDLAKWKIIILVLLFAFSIEALQLLDISKYFNLQDHLWLNIVLGQHFEWLDILMYCCGALTVLFLEYLRKVYL